MAISKQVNARVLGIEYRISQEMHSPQLPVISKVEGPGATDWTSMTVSSSYFCRWCLLIAFYLAFYPVVDLPIEPGADTASPVMPEKIP